MPPPRLHDHREGIREERRKSLCMHILHRILKMKFKIFQQNGGATNLGLTLEVCLVLNLEEGRPCLRLLKTLTREQHSLRRIRKSLQTCSKQGHIRKTRSWYQRPSKNSCRLLL